LARFSAIGMTGRIRRSGHPAGIATAPRPIGYVYSSNEYNLVLGAVVHTFIDHMVNDKLKQLTEYQTKVAELQQSIEEERKEALAHLHEHYGFKTPGDLIKALREVTGAGRKGRGAARRRKHARITPELRQKIKTALQSGKTGAKVAAEFGISLPSVHNIKKEFGLVKSRKKK